MYQVDEHPVLSKPAAVDLKAFFGKAGFTVSNATETTLTANAPRDTTDSNKFEWPTADPTNGLMTASPHA